ncbi:MAG TPA: hypothetical protein DIC64_04880 [Alphaproteobacteria bacterium]|nr:hypothetical protein [Alphaproteobacteria bacterium]
MKKRILKMLGLAAVFAFVAADAMAGPTSSSTTVVSAGITKAANVFQSVRTIVFVIGGFGLVGLAVQAIFGKVKWPWFGALAVGLGVLAAAGALISYATGDAITTSGSGAYGDTFSADNSTQVTGGYQHN